MLKPKWWPDNAHISIAYNYGKNFSPNQKKKKYFKNNEIIFKKFFLMECNGHHLE